MLDKITLDNNNFNIIMNAVRDYNSARGERAIIGIHTTSDDEFSNALRDIAKNKQTSESIINDIKKLLDSLPSNSWMASSLRLNEITRTLGEVCILCRVLARAYGFGDDTMDRAMLAMMYLKYNKYYNKLKTVDELEKALAVIDASSNPHNVTKVTKFTISLIEGGVDLYAKLAKIYYLIIIVDLFVTATQNRASTTLETCINQYTPIIQYILSTTAHYRSYNIKSTEVIVNITSFMDTADENDIAYIISCIISEIDDFGKIETEYCCKRKMLKKSVKIVGDMLVRSQHIHSASHKIIYNNRPLAELIAGYDCSNRDSIEPIITMAFDSIKPLLQDYRDYINATE